MLVLRARLTPELGAVVQQALDAASDRLYQESKDAAPPDSVARGGHVRPAPRRRARAPGRERARSRPRPRRLRPTATRWSCTWRPRPPLPIHHRRRSSNWATAASTFPRKRRGASRAMPRSSSCAKGLTALRWTWVARRGPCRRPYAVHSALAMPDAVSPAARRDAATPTTSPTGPMAATRRSTTWCSLCRRHHRLVHEGGFSVSRDRDGDVTFVRPDGRPLPPSPPMACGWHAASSTAASGLTRCDAGMARGSASPYIIDVLRGHEPIGGRRA